MLLAGRDDLEEARVAFMVTPGCAYAATQRGIWRGGGVAVPLALSHPESELAYVVEDSGATIAVADPAHARTLAPVASAAGIRFVTTDQMSGASIGDLPQHLGATRRAMSTVIVPVRALPEARTFFMTTTDCRSDGGRRH